MRIFNGLKFSDGEDRNNVADVIKKFDQHFLGQTQESGESIDEYVSVMRNMAKTCGFCDCMRELLRASFCKYRTSPDSFKIFNFFLFSPNKPFSELF